MTGRPPPDEAGLREAALTYLARYAATSASLRRVLLRRIDRWMGEQPDPDAARPLADAARALVPPLITTLEAQGLLDDAAFATARAASLRRAGQSSRGIAARLAAKGVGLAMAQRATDSSFETELTAALVLARKRRIGPFRTVGEADAERRRREFGILARAGFPSAIARAALTADREEAEARILALRL